MACASTTKHGELSLVIGTCGRTALVQASKIPRDHCGRATGYSLHERTAYGHARLWAELEAAGKMIEAYDLIVAATALERGSQVATFNKRHFSR